MKPGHPKQLYTISASDMRLINRSAILEYLRTNSPTSRSEISNVLDVSLPTVMRVVDDLLAENLVVNVGEGQSTGGRRRELLTYNKDAYTVIGIDLGGTKLFGALANIGGEIKHQVSVEQHGSSGEECYQLVVEMIEQLLRCQPANQPVRGIAVGAPGITRNTEGIVEWAPSLNWRNYPLKSKLAGVFNLPVYVDNDVNLAVLGEHWFGTGKNVRNMILISIGTGVGAGLILDGMLYRGHSHSSGEIGYLLPAVNALGKTYDQFGALETLVSGLGIVENARRHLASLKPGGNHSDLTSEDVFKAARNHEPWAEKTISETVDYLALAIANINALLDLELVVLSGGVARSADLLLEPIIDRINGTIPRTPRIEISRLGRTSAVMGAIVLVIHAIDEYHIVRKLS